MGPFRVSLGKIYTDGSISAAKKLKIQTIYRIGNEKSESRQHHFVFQYFRYKYGMGC